MSVTDSSKNQSHLVEISANDVLVGMYVSEIDCSWSKTPFSLGGFHVRGADDIQILQKYCRVVTIDTRRGAEPPRRRKSNITILSSARRRAPATAAMKVNRDTYPVTHGIKQQIDKASQAYVDTVAVLEGFAVSIRLGERLPLDALDGPVQALVRAIVANPQTLIWLLLTETKPAEANAYCVRAAVWATLLARQVGVNRDEMVILCKGALLADIGLHLLPERLVNKRGPFRKKEYLAYRKHVDFGMDLLKQYPGLEDKIVRIVRCHHERHDGRGFPRGLRGDQIPVLARFAIFGYCFERLLLTNDKRRNISPAKAISRLYKQRELKFPEQLIVEFIHVMGMYPLGTLVQLSTGELALVLEKNNSNRLQPRIAVITDKLAKPLSDPRVVDLAEKAETGLAVVGSVDPARFKLDLAPYRFRFFGRQIRIGPLGFRL